MRESLGGQQVVLESMLQSVSYTRKRLGGELQNRNGSPLNENQLKDEVKQVVERLKNAGFQPGEDLTLLVF